MKVIGAFRRLQWAWADWRIRRQAQRVESQLATVSVDRSQDPILFFNASTRLYHLSLNAAFSLLASWRMRAEGIPVRYFVCHAGMVQCILGTDPDDPYRGPPCPRCIRYSRGLFPPDLIDRLEINHTAASELRLQMKGQTIETMSSWTYRDYPLGELVLPGLRWALRRHHIPENLESRSFTRQYLASAANLVDRTEHLLQSVRPRTAVVFNGIMYPEAVVRAVARRMGVEVISHEVGLQPYSAYFTRGEATFREIPITGNGSLDAGESVRLERYLERRRLGHFSMAGIKFWPEMGEMPANLAGKIDRYERLIPVFTNVIFDTSQVHANTIFPDMYAWLNDLIDPIRTHPNTLFLIRAHPDEDRPGKASRESVSDWFRSAGIGGVDNAAFIGPDQYVSSYELINRAMFVLVYNSSIGLEAAIEGVPVLSAGRARYTEAGTVAYPTNRSRYRRDLKRWLAGDIRMPDDFRENSRQFLYHELFRASLDLSDFLEPYPAVPGMVGLAPFDLEDLRASDALNAIANGIMRNAPFLLGARLKLESGL